MKSLPALVVFAILITQTFGQGHAASSSSSSNIYSRPIYRPQREPEIVQTRVYSRQPVYQWVGTQGYVDEKTGKTVGSNRQQVLTGYNVTYRVVYDNGSENYYTNFESN